MIKFEYKELNAEFEDWYEAAKWLYDTWDIDNIYIRHLIDSSNCYWLDFTAWVNDNYTAYDILSRCHDELYADLFDKYLYDLAEDLEDDVYDFCKYFTDTCRNYPQADPNLKYFKITYSCGCGENEDYIAETDYKTAEKYAYEQAVEDYHSFEGLHGVRSFDEIAEELFSGDWDDEEEEEPEFDISFLTKDQLAEAQDAYFEEIESTIYWSCEEVSFEEYVENGGRI